MPTTQLGLFETTTAPQDKGSAIARHKHLWRVCWGWDGPAVGGYCEVNQLCADLATPAAGGPSCIYAYMERCKILQQLDDDHWLCEIAMGIVHGQPWDKDGTRVILDTLNIWPPTRDLRRR
ncbi:hypothetical protein [Syntrophotalea acetylenica]|uniref:Uncharacterized protein n=1 Tax=Syntrophotalea acetylenica TaxID=29542 RepID=A0A1L3GDQ8_SYNAC|nr:hypothetical protein [Syntrophotalea acetylenica]APG24091.1 hypothetical protein A7E75_02885 [Syntrophotalea acetylenica]APG44673.1 hypothetical protein A6070_11510 [Syntrophotalea acetylenica]